MTRVYLSPPHMSGSELDLVREAFASNWIAPEGPHLRAFEREVADYVGVGHAVALSSGTAALHLALHTLGVGPGDEVLCSTFTFAATANAVTYQGARPVFIDSDAATWNMDPDLLDEELHVCAARGKLPRAAVVVDLYGQTADYDRILAACARYDVPVVEDAAEALGATYKERKAGSFGRCAVLSFNGNKIITTSGGGMLLSQDAALIDRARHLSTQAREPVAHYEHRSIGFNYRLSNVLAAIGRGQLRVLDDRVASRRRNFAFYEAALGDLPGLAFMPEATYGRSNRWLTCLTIDPTRFGASRDDVRDALQEADIESRPVWNPMHFQPVFSGCRARTRGVSDRIFRTGLCLPSGSALDEGTLSRVASIARSTSSSEGTGTAPPRTAEAIEPRL